MYFGKCFAHQVNLVVKDVFKVVYIKVVNRARILVTKYNASTSKWLSRLNKESKSLYGVTPALLRIIDVRWNSVQATMASILRIRSSFKMVQAKYGGDADFPKELKVDDTFFNHLEDAEMVLRPLTLASFQMLRDSNTLADVLDMFGRLYQGFCIHEFHKLELTQLLEKRWKQQEQPLLLLAFMLHPKYASTFRSMAIIDSRLSVMSMTNYAILYYKKFIGDDFGDLPNQVNKWYYNQFPEAVLYASQEHFRFWNTLESSADRLSALASKVLSFIVQTATCERLFSAFWNFITKKRNRLSSDKAHYLTQVKRQVNRLDEIDENRNIYLTKKVRMVKSTEYKKLDHNNESGDDDDDVLLLGEEDVGEENDIEGGDENPNLVGDLVDEWSQILQQFQEELCEEQTENISQQQIAQDVLDLKYSDGSDFRELHPYPDWNDPNYKHEKWKNTRTIKIELSALFHGEIVLPELTLD